MSKSGIPLGIFRPAGEAHCGFGLAEPLCERPATKHVWLFDDECALLACDEHFAKQIAPRLLPGKHDLHKFGGVCNIPGAEWVHSTPETEGCCAFPGLDDAAVEAVTLEVGDGVALIGAPA